MELEKEPRKPTPPKVTPQEPSPPSKIYRAQPTETFLPIQRRYAQEVCVVMGIALVVMGLVGFVVDNFLGAHLSYTHNAIHVASGALSLWFGFDSALSAKRFSYIFGTIYGVLGVLGFLFGSLGIPAIGSLVEDRYLWKPIPDVLELGTVDHSLHILFGVVFLLGATLTFKRYKKI